MDQINFIKSLIGEKLSLKDWFGLNWEDQNFQRQNFSGWNWKPKLKKKIVLPGFPFKKLFLSQPIFLCLFYIFEKNKNCLDLVVSHVTPMPTLMPATYSNSYNTQHNILEHQLHVLQATHHCTLPPLSINSERKHNDERGRKVKWGAGNILKKLGMENKEENIEAWGKFAKKQRGGAWNNTRNMGREWNNIENTDRKKTQWNIVGKTIS